MNFEWKQNIGSEWKPLKADNLKSAKNEASRLFKVWGVKIQIRTEIKPGLILRWEKVTGWKSRWKKI